MNEFYTNVQVYGKKILYRGIREDGKRIKARLDFKPSLFVLNKDGKHETIDGKKVAEIKPGSPKDCKNFINENKDIPGMPIFGMPRFEYQYIADTFQDHIDWTKSHVHVMYMDIEVASDGGYADPKDPWQPLTSICMKMNGRVVVLGIKDFKTDRQDVKYIKCDDEISLLQMFLKIWTSNYPDILTGWFTKIFDIPYLVNRIALVLGEEEAKRISPWGHYYKRNWLFMNKQQTAYVIYGIAQLDYVELYRKFAAKGQSQESYALNYICSEEIGEKKVDYSQYQNLNKLYEDDHQKFIEYNIHDTELVESLDDKLGLIELAMTLAYDSKCNYEDVFMQVRMWTILIYNKLKETNRVIPLEFQNARLNYMGAYVKDPIVGLHNWVVSFDLTSLYPHLMMQYNISPDTIIDAKNYNDDMRRIFSENKISIDTLLEKSPDVEEILKRNHCALTPNKQLFRIDKKGFLPEMMEEMFADRKRYKTEMLKASQELEQETDPVKKKEIEARVSRFNNLQLTKKICLNSAYGALGNEYFIFFDVRQAEAITSSGQLSIRWIADALNKYMNKVLKTENKDYVIASDTDSIYLSLDGVVNQTIKKKNPNVETAEVIAFMDKVCEDKIQPFINESYNELATYLNAYDQRMIMKRETLCDKGIWTAKKRYILNVYNSEGVQYAKPKVKITGLEAIKSSTPNSCRVEIKKAIDVILNQNEEALQKFVRDYRKKFKELPIEDIAFPRSVNGLFKERGPGVGMPIHVKGAKTYNEALRDKNLTDIYEDIQDGEKIKYVYLKQPNPYCSHVMAFLSFVPPEFNLKEHIDYDVQFEKSFVLPVEIVTNVIGWKTKKINTLEGLF